MPLPPSLIMRADVGFGWLLAVLHLGFLKKPLSPGPTFCSALSALWHTTQLVSNTSFPLAASPAAFFCPNRLGPANRVAKQLTAIKLFFIVIGIVLVYNVCLMALSLKPGDPAPEIRTSAFQLSKLRGRRVVIFFFPKSDTPGCTREACEFRDASDQFTKLRAEIVGVSPDAAEAQQKFSLKYGFPYTLVPDPTHAIAEAYGVWKQKSMYGRQYMGVERTTFLIDPEGRIEKIFSKVKPDGHAAQVLEAIPSH